jgi:hypothetical protein
MSEPLRDQIIAWIEADGRVEERRERIGLIVDFIIEEFHISGQERALIAWAEIAEAVRHRFDLEDFDCRR